MAVATCPTVAIVMESLHHLRKMSAEEHGNDTAMKDQIQDCHPDPHLQIIHPMMCPGNVQMATDPGLAIWTVTGVLQEAELAHHPSTPTSLATALTAEDEMIGLQGTTDFPEKIDLQR